MCKIKGNSNIILRITILVIIIVLLFISCFKENNNMQDINKEEAITIAENALIVVFGSWHIERYKPFIAYLENGIWYVEGTLYSKPGEVVRGGVPYVEIRKEDGIVLNIYHDK